MHESFFQEESFNFAPTVQNLSLLASNSNKVNLNLFETTVSDDGALSGFITLFIKRKIKRGSLVLHFSSSEEAKLPKLNRSQSICPELDTIFKNNDILNKQIKAKGKSRQSWRPSGALSKSKSRITPVSALGFIGWGRGASRINAKSLAKIQKESKNGPSRKASIRIRPVVVSKKDVEAMLQNADDLVETPARKVDFEDEKKEGKGDENRFNILSPAEQAAGSGKAAKSYPVKEILSSYSIKVSSPRIGDSKNDSNALVFVARDQNQNSTKNQNDEESGNNGQPGSPIKAKNQSTTKRLMSGLARFLRVPSQQQALRKRGLSKSFKKKESFKLRSSSKLIYTREIKLFTFPDDYQGDSLSLVLPFRIELSKQLPCSHDYYFSITKKLFESSSSLRSLKEIESLKKKMKIKETSLVSLSSPANQNKNQEFVKVISSLKVFYIQANELKDCSKEEDHEKRLEAYQSTPGYIDSQRTTLKVIRDWTGVNKDCLKKKKIEVEHKKFCFKVEKRFISVQLSIRKLISGSQDRNLNFVFAFQRSLLRHYKYLDLVVKTTLLINKDGFDDKYDNSGFDFLKPCQAERGDSSSLIPNKLKIGKFQAGLKVPSHSKIKGKLNHLQSVINKKARTGSRSSSVIEEKSAESQEGVFEEESSTGCCSKTECQHFLERVTMVASFELSKKLPKVKLDDSEMMEFIKKICLKGVKRKLETINLSNKQIRHHICFYVSKKELKFDRQLFSEEIYFYKSEEVKKKMSPQLESRMLKALDSKVNKYDSAIMLPHTRLSLSDLEVGRVTRKKQPEESKAPNPEGSKQRKPAMMQATMLLR